MSRQDARPDRLNQRLQQTTLATAEAPKRDEERKREIYRQRAERLAAPAAEPEPSDEQRVATLVFVLGDRQFGVPLRHVAQVCPARPLTRVPRAPTWLLGIAGFDAQIRSVVDLASLLEAAEAPEPTGGHILLVHAADGTVAARVDRVEEVRRIDFCDLSDPDQAPGGAAGRFIHGVTPQHVAIVCAETLVTHTTSRRRVPA